MTDSVYALTLFPPAGPRIELGAYASSREMLAALVRALYPALPWEAQPMSASAAQTYHTWLHTVAEDCLSSPGSRGVQPKDLPLLHNYALWAPLQLAARTGIA